MFLQKGPPRSTLTMKPTPTLYHELFRPFVELAGNFSGAYTRKRILLLATVTIVAYIVIINSSWNATPDSALYLSLGESVARGDGYIFNGERHTMVPPGYPCIVAGWAKIFGANFLSYRIMMALFGLIMVGSGFLFLRRLGGNDLAIVIGGIFAISHVGLLNSTMTLSDVPFAVFSLVSLYAVIASVSGQMPYRWVLLSAVLASIPPVIRINGLGIPPVEALFLWFAFKGKSKTKALVICAIFLFISTIPTIAWQVWKSSFPVSHSEGAYLTNVVGRSLESHIHVTLKALVALGPTIAEAITGANIKTGFLEYLILLVTLIGLVRAWRLGDRLLAPLIVIQFCGLLLTAPGSRYVLFLIPSLLIMFLLGLEWLFLELRAKFGLGFSDHRALITMAIILFASNFGANFLTWYQCRFPVQPGGAQTERSLPYFKTARWLKENAPDAVVMTTKSRIIHYLSGCKTVALLKSGYPEQDIWVDEQKEVQELYKRTKPGYIFLDMKSEKLSNMITKAIKGLSMELHEVKEAQWGERFILHRIIEPNGKK